MLIEDLIGSGTGIGSRELQTIATQCSQFLQESDGLPLFKSLSPAYDDFYKVKVRFQKKKDTMAEAYEKAFNERCLNLRQRAIFAYSTAQPITEAAEPFYVFPTNGFKFMYSREVKNSNSDYRRVIDTLFEQFDDTVKATEIVVDLLKYTYSTEKLVEGINSDSEIILYGIPNYYAVRVSAVPSYSKLITYR